MGHHVVRDPQDGVRWVQHSGGLHGFITNTCFEPKERVGAIVSLNGEAEAADLSMALGPSPARPSSVRAPSIEAPEPTPTRTAVARALPVDGSRPGVPVGNGGTPTWCSWAPANRHGGGRCRRPTNRTSPPSNPVYASPASASSSTGRRTDASPRCSWPPTPGRGSTGSGDGARHPDRAPGSGKSTTLRTSAATSGSWVSPRERSWRNNERSMVTARTTETGRPSSRCSNNARSTCTRRRNTRRAR